MGNSGAIVPRPISKKEAKAFIDFVLRHTWPERAKAHGHAVVHDIIKHHPFVIEHGSIDATGDE